MPVRGSSRHGCRTRNPPRARAKEANPADKGPYRRRGGTPALKKNVPPPEGVAPPTSLCSLGRALEGRRFRWFFSWPWLLCLHLAFHFFIARLIAFQHALPGRGEQLFERSEHHRPAGGTGLTRIHVQFNQV